MLKRRVETIPDNGRLREPASKTADTTVASIHRKSTAVNKVRMCAQREEAGGWGKIVRGRSQSRLLKWGNGKEGRDTTAPAWGDSTS